MRELGAGQSAHALQGQVAQVGLAMLQELAQLVTCADEQVWLTAGTGEVGWVRAVCKSAWQASMLCRVHSHHNAEMKTSGASQNAKALNVNPEVRSTFAPIVTTVK